MGELRGDQVVSRGTWRKRCLVVTVMCLTAALAACGGGDDEDPAAAQNPPNNPPTNPPSTTLTIAGTPAAQALQGSQYSFTPTVSSPGGTLTYTIQGTPAWATFNQSTGRLQGTPQAQHVGQVSSNIRISVSNGTSSANLAAFSVTVVATATGSALLSWTPPTTNTDGSALTLTGYRVYWGTSPGNYSNSVTIGANVTSHVIDQLTPARWYFAATAISATGESTYSNEASKMVQ
jgi:hypothetical protein